MEPQNDQQPAEPKLNEDNQPSAETLVSAEKSVELSDSESKKDDKFDLAQPYSWQAVEGIQGKKTSSWYIIFIIAILVLMALAIFVFKSWTFAVLLPVMAVAVILLASKPPQTINYSVSPKGVYVADKLYDFSEFRSFGVLPEEDCMSAVLLPVKRFSPGLTIYFDEKDGEAIVDMLGARLPMQEIKHDALEKFIRLIRL